jgi:hypothetical protein
MKLNFMTDQGSILDSTSWARRVGGPAPLGAGLGAAAGCGGGRNGRDERAGFLTLGLVRAANGAVTLAATPGGGAGGTWAGYGGA